MARSDQAPTTSWFYRVGEREIGPVMSGRLRQLARQGRLAEDDLVRMGRTGEWVCAASIDWLKARPRANPQLKPAGVQGPRHVPPGAMAELGTSLAYSLRNIYYSIAHLIIASLWLVRHALGVAALIAIGVTLFNIARDVGLFGRREPVDALRTVQSLGEQIKQSRMSQATDAQWQDLKQRGTAALVPVVAELERTAGHEDRTAQMLLWAARDCLPRMFDDARHEPSDSEILYDEYLSNVELLRKNEPIYGGSVRGQTYRSLESWGDRYQAMTSPGGAGLDRSTIALVTVLILVDVAIVVWLVRAWRRRRA